MDPFSTADLPISTADTGQLCWREQLILSAMILPFISLLYQKAFSKSDSFLLETESLSTNCWMTSLQGSSFSPTVPFKGAIYDSRPLLSYASPSAVRTCEWEAGLQLLKVVSDIVCPSFL